MSPAAAAAQAYLIYSSSVAAGAQSGIEECKYQFARREPCSCPPTAACAAVRPATHRETRTPVKARISSSEAELDNDGSDHSKSGNCLCARHQLGWRHVHSNQELQSGRL